MKKNIIKNIIKTLLVATIMVSCNRDTLDIPNPNEPSIESAKTESGILAYALGLYNKGFGEANFTNTLANHEIMGDQILIPWGNYGWRWTSQVNDITLPNGKVIKNPNGLSQKDQLQSTNTRAAGENNSFQFEWNSMYLLLGQVNNLIKFSDDPALVLTGDAQAKRKFIKAWGLWWKGYAYSRLGSMYLAGVVVDNAGQTNGNYVDRNALIAEGNKNLDAAAAIFNTLTNDTTYSELFMKVVPSFCRNSNIVDPQMMVRHINTMKARNLMVNKKAKTMSAGDWTQILTLANAGLKQGDYPLVYSNTVDGANSLWGYAPQPWFPLFLNYDGWWFVSPRHIQEYKDGDARLDKNFYDYGAPLIINPRGRGIQFGTTYDYNPISYDGSYSSDKLGSDGAVPLSGTFEENELMIAEAKINSGNIPGGLASIDKVRNYQNSGLPSVSGTITALLDAKEELRKERRVALFLRGLSFYDARRWGVTEPKASGGGRAGASVLVPAGASFMGLTSPAYKPCFMNYDYMDYWDVPANELDFNPSTSGAVIKN